MHIVDRRPNPKDRSLANRQRFMGRQQAEVKEALKKAIKKRRLGNNGSQDIPIPNTKEPIFRHNGTTGKREYVVPGNKTHSPGEKIPRQPIPQHQPGGGGAPDGEGEHDFRITLDYDEFVKLFLEDMGLPDLFRLRTH